MIYLDNAATTFPKPQCVIQAVTSCMTEGAVNAGRGVYPLAQEAEKLISETRKNVALLIGYTKGQVIFTSSATLATNQILFGLDWVKGDAVYITPLEHNSVARVIHNIQYRFGIEVIPLPIVKEYLEYDLDEIKKAFFKKPPKVIVMTHVSNVCGLITPIEKIAKIAKEYGATIIIDGSQGGPLLPQTEPEDSVDFYVFSGHKTFYGPFGIAGFVTNGKHSLTPIIFGGTGSHSEQLSMPDELPYRFEVGSHNIIAITGLNAACKWLKEIGVDQIVTHERDLLALTYEELIKSPRIKTFINKDLNNHLGVLSLIIDGYTSQEVGMILSQHYDIAIRAGLHCAPMAHDFLGTLPHGTVRIGFGYFNTKEDAYRLIHAIEEIVE